MRPTYWNRAGADARVVVRYQPAPARPELLQQPEGRAPALVEDDDLALPPGTRELTLARGDAWVLRAAGEAEGLDQALHGEAAYTEAM